MSDEVVTYKIIHSVGPRRHSGGLYVVADGDYPDRESARKAAEKIPGRFAAVFPLWKVSRVLEGLNRSTKINDMLDAFDEICELHTTTTDSDSFANDVGEILRSLKKDCDEPVEGE